MTHPWIVVRVETDTELRKWFEEHPDRHTAA